MMKVAGTYSQAFWEGSPQVRFCWWLNFNFFKMFEMSVLFSLLHSFKWVFQLGLTLNKKQAVISQAYGSKKFIATVRVLPTSFFAVWV